MVKSNHVGNLDRHRCDRIGRVCECDGTFAFEISDGPVQELFGLPDLRTLALLLQREGLTLSGFDLIQYAFYRNKFFIHDTNVICLSVT